MNPMIIVLLLYFAILCIIAIHSAMNVKSVPDFFVARKGASVKAVAGSLVASILGGSAIIGAIDESNRLGAGAAWFMLVGALGLAALIPFASKAYSLGKYSLPDLIGNMYGSTPRIVSSIVIPIAWTGIIAAQIIAAAKILQSFTPLSYETCAIIFASIFTLYTIAGGQLSILRTDFLQAALIVVGLAIIAIFTGLSLEGSNYTLSNAKAFPFNSNFSPLDLFILLLTYGTTFTAGPDMFSRLFCAKDATTAKKSLFVSAIVLVPVAGIIGFLSAFGTNIETTDGAKIISIANTVLPQAMLPFIAIVLLSVVLSSADTLLLSSSVILCGLFLPNENWKKEKTEKTQRKPLHTARLVILANGLVALLIALHFTNIIGILLMALAIYAGAFTIPILWGLAGFRTKTAYVSIAIISGGLIALTGKLIPVLADSWGIAHTARLESILLITSFIINAMLLLIGKIHKK